MDPRKYLKLTLFYCKAHIPQVIIANYCYQRLIGDSFMDPLSSTT